MHYLVLLVVDDVNKCPDLFDAWEAAGVGGITIVESTGLHRIRQKAGHHDKEGFRDDVPLMPSLRSLLHGHEEHHRTIFSVVQGEEMVDKLVAATESVVGELSEPDTGILFALPLARVVGVPRRSGDIRPGNNNRATNV
ncbi:hypothetical protein [Promineifilum sp.]|uniref:hypothetical protein n=1 Tax=Promineifilum sp. TaxID=2664178 RepID=UPI0035B12A9E